MVKSLAHRSTFGDSTEKREMSRRFDSATFHKNHDGFIHRTTNGMRV